MIYLCNLYLSSLSAPLRAQNITHSVQLQSNLKEPKIVRAEIPCAEGISASTAPTLLGSAAARSSLTAPSVHRDERSWRSRSLRVVALMDGSERRHSHLGSAGRCLLKNQRWFFFLLGFFWVLFSFSSRKTTGNCKFLPASAGSGGKALPRHPGSCWWCLKPETAEFEEGGGQKMVLGLDLISGPHFGHDCINAC